ncbi:hypothetical protein DIU31_024200 [Mucilaginibacter rubeus]|uniref:Uncharacterized protein n=1 Tax=Mucilaginibacter rubeus TaxID=2027860 RepID=A0AAE6JKE1_9SPHI|nr:MULTISPECIES: hypothetical protein [Mucilaginibacter]QEM06465.1 hypothetical protein DIU31_024200 [Mucilaginibacter rubeus]QEM19051.1 hypothetical protein DIU38_024450 [Mucilaginibacter gossypii]QTE44408.1 hypothetical protein J3L19_03270 [Mucilaginibacter rubeus]QTE51007.1 hypothetical protein J3L21_03245 [Mucilaginibacter rubeus]QTE56090.1 hypothetical protein J3L23_28485 [Mucilaginibacter rubeus]
MKYLLFDTFGMDDDEVQLLKHTYEALNDRFKVHFIHPSEIKSLKVFDRSFKRRIAGSLLIRTPLTACYLIFTKIDTKARVSPWHNPSVNGYRYQVYAISTLKKNFGRVFIRKKSTIDRIINLFNPDTISLKADRAFFKRFYVIANEKDKALAAMTASFRRIIDGVRKECFITNIIDYTLVVEHNERLKAEKTIKMVEFANSLSVIS